MKNGPFTVCRTYFVINQRDMQGCRSRPFLEFPAPAPALAPTPTLVVIVIVVIVTFVIVIVVSHSHSRHSRQS